MRKVKKHGLLGFLALALLLGACNQQGGGNTVTVRLTDPQNALQGAYYRVGSGSWTPLTFTNGQATFQASNTYEVAARCGTEIQLYKATQNRLPVLPIVCSQEDTPGDADVVGVSFNISLPNQIGNTPIQDNDQVVVGDRFLSVTDLQANGHAYLPLGQQWVALAVLRATPTDPDVYDITPIGGKLVDLNIQEGQSYTVDATNWVPLTPKDISQATPP